MFTQFVREGERMLLFNLKRRKERIRTVPPRDAEFWEKSGGGLSAKTDCSFCGAAVSDVGCARKNNEDNYILANNMNCDSSEHSAITVSNMKLAGVWQLTGVFDGMGGGELGELASRETARIFLKADGELSDCHSKTEADSIVRKAFLEANNRIVLLQKEYNIFGTTGTVLCTNGEEFKIYHLGDSRAYLKHADKLIQITEDQTLAQMKKEAGIYREDDPSAEADKHKLTEYIGRDWTKEHIRPVESLWMPVRKKDCILLCSDGLYDMCDEDGISGILRGNASVAEMASELVNAAKANGGEDNITCIVVLFS